MKLLLWTARTLDVFLLLLVTIFASGEGIPSPSALHAPEWLLTGALLVMLSGLVVAWRSEGVGSLLLLAGFGLFWAVNSASTGHLRVGWTFSLFAVAGLLFALHWTQTRHHAG